MKMNTYKQSLALFAGRALLVVDALFGFSLSLVAGSGQVDLSFNPGSGVNGRVLALAMQPDGKTVIAGSFSTVNGAVRNGLARLNRDGTADLTFRPHSESGGIFSFVSIVPGLPGKVMVAGSDGMGGNGLRLLNTDGSVDRALTEIFSRCRVATLARQLSSSQMEN
jgi:hypothetical protein